MSDDQMQDQTMPAEGEETQEGGEETTEETPAEGGEEMPEGEEKKEEGMPAAE